MERFVCYQNQTDMYYRVAVPTCGMLMNVQRERDGLRPTWQYGKQLLRRFVAMVLRVHVRLR